MKCLNNRTKCVKRKLLRQSLNNDYTEKMTDLSATYRKMSQREHVLELPDTYIGSIENIIEEAYVVDGDKFTLKALNVNPGLYKLFDELIVNAHDQSIRTKQRGTTAGVKNIEVSISEDNKTITFWNDGDGIPVEKHPQHKMYIPQLIFGELLTSTNYDKDEKKIVGGKNGYGAKLANIFSTSFVIETVDANTKQKYTQTFSSNMSVVEPPKIVSCKNKPYVSIAWTPDFGRFKMSSITPDMRALFHRRVTDIAMTLGKDVKVYWNENGKKDLIKCKDLSAYAKEHVEGPVVYEQINERWAVAIADTPTEKYFHASFVNGIWTSKGGTHGDYITNQVVSHIVEYLETKKKIKVKPSLVKDSLAIFVNCLVENPSFSSQTKEVLTTKSSAFGSKCQLSDEFLKKVQTKLKVVETILDAQRIKDDKDSKKTDGKKSSKIYGIPKLEDAVYAGTVKSGLCTLILTEGDSAKAMALSGLSQEQRKTFGIFPLRGKLLNVKDKTAARVELAEEIANLKKILGLESGKSYKDVSSLRYGSILIMTDQDFDGSHIRGLLINLFHELWHELIAIPGFITYMATPIVKANKGKQARVFYTQYEYEQWRKSDESKNWNVKYYKGLGTSTRTEAQEYFKELNVMAFKFTEESDQAIDLAFNKSRADDRKEWLLKHDPANIVIPHADKKLSYDEFVHRDLIHFSYYNVERAIPSVMDGLKTSQRKILYAAFKRKLTSEIKVAQFSGYVAEHTSYHHGEQSLQDAIVGMAQDFVGSNNINLFAPCGQFGTRLEGGKDSASPRYIFTHLTVEAQKLFPSEDFPVLNYRDDDGMTVEPHWYAPILPMVLINGATGIGTGFSTEIPQYNPAILADIIQGWLDSKDDSMIADAKIVPWYRGFTGTITPDGKGDFICKADWSYDKSKKIVKIRDLPIGVWSSEFKALLCKLEEEKKIKDFADTSNDASVSFDIMLFEDMDATSLEKMLKLTDKIKVSNMHCFDSHGNIKKYNNPNEIVIEFAKQRLALYQTRKDYLLKDLNSQLPYHEEVVRFIKMQTQDTPTPDLRRKSRSECDKLLESSEFRRIDSSFDFLMKLPIYSFTSETIAKHENDLKKLKEQIQTIGKLTSSEMWTCDLRAWKEIKQKK